MNDTLPPTPPAERPTPITDAWREKDMHTMEKAFRQMESLERQLAEAREEVAHWKAQCSRGFNVAQLIQERDELREQCNRLVNAVANAAGVLDAMMEPKPSDQS